MNKSSTTALASLTKAINHDEGRAGVLKQRVLSALILAPLVLASVLLLPTLWFALVLGLFLLLAAEEWARFVGFVHVGGYLGFIAMIAALLGGLGLLMHAGVSLLPLLYLAVAGWLWVLFGLVRTREVSVVEGFRPSTALAGLWVLPMAWLGMVWLHQAERGPYLLIVLLLLIWSADIGAYFAGRRWGKRKLAPCISPGKTWAGVYGAFAGAAVWALLAGGLLGFSWMSLPFFLLLCLLVVAASIVGDLYESKLKRQCGVKDSGILLPGHGGVMDRIDSLTAAAPLFAAGMAWFGVGG